MVTRETESLNMRQNPKMDIFLSDLPPETATIPLLTPQPCSSTQGIQPAKHLPTVRIVEQPLQSVRFRYESEGRIEPIFGRNSVKCKRKTYPAIELCGGHEGPAKVQVSLVTAQKPYLQHPHKLHGTEENSNGIYEFNVQLKKENSVIVVQNLGIQCTLQRDIANELTARKELGVDPFRSGFKHIDSPKTINLKAVRLCFSVTIYDIRTSQETELEPVVSCVIYDGKALMNLTIKELSIHSDYHFGGSRLIILCGWVTTDVSVVFFEKVQDRIVWEAYAAVDYVHHHVAIACFVPKYHSNRDAEVGVQLRMSSNMEEGERYNVMPFSYKFKYSDSDLIRMKGKKRLSPHIQTLERLWRDTSNHPLRIPQENVPIAGPSGAAGNSQMLPPWVPYTQTDHFNNQDLFSDQSVLSVRDMMPNDIHTFDMPFNHGQAQQNANSYSAMQVSGNADTSMHSIAGGEDFDYEYLNNTHAQQQAVSNLALPQFSTFIDRVNGQNTYVPQD